jgi:hypothetical protein
MPKRRVRKGMHNVQQNVIHLLVHILEDHW